MGEFTIRMIRIEFAEPLVVGLCPRPMIFALTTEAELSRVLADAALVSPEHLHDGFLREFRIELAQPSVFFFGPFLAGAALRFHACPAKTNCTQRSSSARGSAAHCEHKPAQETSSRWVNQHVPIGPPMQGVWFVQPQTTQRFSGSACILRLMILRGGLRACRTSEISLVFPNEPGTRCRGGRTSH
jgi:hypothetical protein